MSKSCKTADNQSFQDSTGAPECISRYLGQKQSCLKLGCDNIQKWNILKGLFQNMLGTCPLVPIRSGTPATYYAMLCNKSLLIGSSTFNLGPQFCRSLVHRDLQYAFGKVYDILMDIQKLQGVLGFFGSFLHFEATPFYIINRQKGVLDCFPLQITDFSLFSLNLTLDFLNLVIDLCFGDQPEAKGIVFGTG